MAETTGRLHLKPRHRAVIEGLLKKHLPGVEVWAYGSRVNGRSHDGSDLDLVLRAPELREIPIGPLGELWDALRESTIPFLVEARDWARLPESFHREIERDYVVLAHSTAGRKPPANWLYHPLFPAHWNRRPLYSMAQWINGLAYRNIEFSATGCPVIKIAEIKGGISDQTKLTYQNFDESVRVRTGDLLFSWSGQPETSIDAFWWRGPEGWLNQHIFRVIPSAGIDTTFFFYLLRYLNPNFVAIARNKQTTGLGHVTKRDLENIEAALPAHQEQRDIAHILGTLDDKIELNRRMNETLEAMAQSLFKSWFVDFDPVRAKMEGRDTGLPKPIADLFPNRLVSSEFGEIPEGWKNKSLGECFSLTMGQSPPGNTYNDHSDGLPFFQGRTDFGFRFPENRKFSTAPTRIAQPEDTLVSVRAPVGDINMAWEQCCIGRGVAALRHKSGSSSFTYYSAWAVQDKIKTYEHTGTVFGAINRRQFEALEMLEPRAELIKAFDAHTGPVDIRIRDNTSESRTLTALRDALLPKLISGEIRLRDAARQVESAA